MSHDNRELIDTQWDVNKYGNFLIFEAYCELIDTWWDVNKDDSEIVIPLTKN